MPKLRIKVVQKIIQIINAQNSWLIVRHVFSHFQWFHIGVATSSAGLSATLIWLSILVPLSIVNHSTIQQGSVDKGVVAHNGIILNIMVYI